MTEPRYPPDMEQLFAELRQVIVPFLGARAEAGDAFPEFAAVAIVGEHLAICFALISDAAVRREALESWPAELPRVVDAAVAGIERGGARLQ